MITEDFCSFEVAKLLKEKGFNELCNGRYSYRGGNVIIENYPISNESLKYHPNIDGISAPTHQMAMKWLREVHNILITIIPQEIGLGFDKLCFGIYRITEDLYQPLYNGKLDNLVNSYEEAVEAALEYLLKNLI